ncbi:MAG: hypothetical protein ACFFKA_14675 [Candidatus Thorarchaeota archaeon]
MAQLKDGKLVCLMRTDHRPNRQDNMWFTWRNISIYLSTTRDWAPLLLCGKIL